MSRCFWVSITAKPQDNAHTPQMRPTACFIFLGSSLAHGVPCAYSERFDLHTELLMRLQSLFCPNHHYLLATFCPNHHYLLAAFCPNHHYLIAAFFMHPLFLCGLHMDTISTINYFLSLENYENEFVWHTWPESHTYINGICKWFRSVQTRCCGSFNSTWYRPCLSLNVHVNKLMTSFFQLRTLLFIT